MADTVSILALVLVAATAFGFWRRVRDGQIRATASPAPDSSERLTPADLNADLGSTATFVQFSTAFCQPCRATRLLLENVSQERNALHDGSVVHVEIDAENNLELVRRFDVMRTPTVLVLDHNGVIRGRATGVPRKDQVLRTIDSLNS